MVWRDSQTSVGRNRYTRDYPFYTQPLLCTQSPGVHVCCSTRSWWCNWNRCSRWGLQEFLKIRKQNFIALIKPEASDILKNEYVSNLFAGLCNPVLACNNFQLGWTQKPGEGGDKKEGFFGFSPLIFRGKAQHWCFGLPGLGCFAAYSFPLLLILKIKKHTQAMQSSPLCLQFIWASVTNVSAVLLC